MTRIEIFAVVLTIVVNLPLLNVSYYFLKDIRKKK